MKRYTLTIQQTGTVVALWMGLLMLPLAPLNNRFSAAGVLLFLTVAFATRNIAFIATTAAVLNLVARFFLPGSSWHDQHWVQWSSISSLLTGHNIFSSSPLYQFSLSSYMPLGDLFGGFFIALGIHQYWLVWHVLVVCLVALPLLLAPSFATLLIFIAFSSVYPFCDYTTGGGTVEIAYALTIGAIAVFRSSGLFTPALILFAFAAMFRQPSLLLIPFLILVLWRERDRRRICIFAALLFLFGGIYILNYPAGAFHYLYSVWEGYHQELFNFSPGLQANYSISSLPRAWGVPDQVAWYAWRSAYTPIGLAGIAALFGLAWFRQRREEVLLLGVLASASVYVLSRGYAQFAYVCTAFFPLAAFSYPVPAEQPAWRKRIAWGIALLFVWIGSTPAFLYVAAFTERKWTELHPPVAFSAPEVREVRVAAPTLSLPPLNGDDANRHIFPLTSSAQFNFTAPVEITGIRLSCDHVAIQDIKGVAMRYPTDIQMRGAITDGLIEGSENGRDFVPLRHFLNSATYCIWPVTISLPPTPHPLAAVRLKPYCLYLDQQEWILGNVEFLGNKVP